MTDWRPVVGWAGYYEVSNLGDVRSVTRVIIRSDGKTQTVGGVLMHPTPVKSGHLHVTLRRPGVRKFVPVHHLVLEAFDGPCPPGLEACHGNSIPSDNRRENLRWDTRNENVLDRVRSGTHHNSRKTRCKRDHPFSDVYTSPSGKTMRRCKQCRTERKTAA